MKQLLMSVVLLLGSPVLAGETIAPWPPVSQDTNGPRNWPIPHPQRGIDLNLIPSGQVFNSLSLRERKAVQRELIRFGYYQGAVDGKWGPGTWYGTVIYAKRVGIETYLDSVQGSLRVFQHITN